MFKPLLFSAGALLLLAGCNDSQTRYHDRHVAHPKSAHYHRENIDAAAPWHARRNHVPNVNDRRQPLPRAAHEHRAAKRDNIDRDPPWKVRRNHVPGITDRPHPMPRNR